jgi:hypothetical protein
MLLPIVDDGTFIIFPDMFAIFVDRMEFHNGHRCMKGPGSRNLPLLVVADLSDVCLRAGSCWRSDAPTVLKWRAVVTRRKRRAVLSDASRRRLLAHLQVWWSEVPGAPETTSSLKHAFACDISTLLQPTNPAEDFVARW